MPRCKPPYLEIFPWLLTSVLLYWFRHKHTPRGNTIFRTQKWMIIQKDVGVGGIHLKVWLGYALDAWLWVYTWKFLQKTQSALCVGKVIFDWEHQSCQNDVFLRPLWEEGQYKHKIVFSRKPNGVTSHGTSVFEPKWGSTPTISVQKCFCSSMVKLIFST